MTRGVFGCLLLPLAPPHARTCDWLVGAAVGLGSRHARFPLQPGSRQTPGEVIPGGPGSPDAGALSLMMVLNK